MQGTRLLNTVSETTGDITNLLRQVRSGDKDANGKLMAALQVELRQLAARAMRHERPGHTLQPTALVNEAFIRLASNSAIESKDRAHFLAIAARLMREILVDYARRRGAQKRGSGMKMTLDDGLALADDRLDDVIGCDELLGRLEQLDARQARIVELRFFAGLSVEEVAEILEVSAPTVKREWASARAWLHRELTARRAP